MMEDEKKLILVRHAHRDTSARELDNGLTAKGRKQAEKLAADLIRKYPDMKPPEVRVLSSPKKRCIETLQPLADSLNASIQIDTRLVEKQDDEGSGTFQGRVKKFLDDWQSQTPDKLPGITVICSHGDWLPLAIFLLFNARSDFEKGGWTEIELIENLPYLRFTN